MRDEVIRLFKETELTQREIAERCGLKDHQIEWIASKYLSREFLKERKKICYRRSKLGDKNPMTGKRKEECAHYIGEVSDGKGYLMIIKPDWYTGRKGCKHVFVHHIVICESLGLTEIPKGFCVHHIDHNPKNNNINNLALLTLAAHTKLHQLERATTRGNS